MNCPLKHFEACEEKLCAWYDDDFEKCYIFTISDALRDIEDIIFNKKIT